MATFNGKNSPVPAAKTRGKNTPFHGGEGLPIRERGEYPMDYDYRITGRTLQKLRRERKLTQEVLSGLAGISRSHLAEIETGRTQANVETLWSSAQPWACRSASCSAGWNRPTTRKRAIPNDPRRGCKRTAFCPFAAPVVFHGNTRPDCALTGLPDRFL